MAEPLSSVDIFNQTTGRIFASLYESFPIPSPLNTRSLASRVLGREAPPVGGSIHDTTSFGPDAQEFHRYDSIALHTIEWLAQTGFITKDRADNYVLTPKGFEALSAVPQSLSPTEPIGRQLIDATRFVGEEASKATISGLVGQVIGIVSRLLLGF